jgi:superfamily II DNA or RNA helicase
MANGCGVRRLIFNPSSPLDYALFLKIKSLPKYRFVGDFAEVPEEYLDRLGLATGSGSTSNYLPMEGLFDYQRDIAALAILKRRYAVFADCGLGKTLIATEFARHALANIPRHQSILIVSPLMVIGQTIAEAKRFYGDALPIEQVHARDLAAWLTSRYRRIGITNYDALNDSIPSGNLGGLILDESSMLKSHYGKWGATCIRLGRGLTWKLALTGTPAPNDRIEFANHAVFLDQFPTVNSFLSRFFINRGQTQNRWELKAHAIRAFYRALSHWCIFLSNPATYEWKDNVGTIPPIQVHIHDIALTSAQRMMVQETTGNLFAAELGGITTRSKLGQISKGNCNGQKIETLKPAFIRDMAMSQPDRSTIIWCHYNAEQEALAALLPEAGNITGDTPIHERIRVVDEFKTGRRRLLITKGKILGFGQNMQICTRMIFSGLQDSYETFYQCVKRANRVGSTEPLDVHIPVTEVERPMLDTVLRKAKRVQQDTQEQERIFKEISDAAR